MSNCPKCGKKYGYGSCYCHESYSCSECNNKGTTSWWENGNEIHEPCGCQYKKGQLEALSKAIEICTQQVWGSGEGVLKSLKQLQKEIYEEG